MDEKTKNKLMLNRYYTLIVFAAISFMLIDEKPICKWLKNNLYTDYSYLSNDDMINKTLIEEFLKEREETIYDDACTLVLMTLLSIATFTPILLRDISYKTVVTRVGLFFRYNPTNNIFPNRLLDQENEFICPISLEFMKKPVYDRKYPKLPRIDESSLLQAMTYKANHPLLSDIPYIKDDWIDDLELAKKIQDYLEVKNSHVPSI